MEGQAVYAINTVQVNGQEKYLIVSTGVPGTDPGSALGWAVSPWPTGLALHPSLNPGSV